MTSEELDFFRQMYARMQMRGALGDELAAVQASNMKRILNDPMLMDRRVNIGMWREWEAEYFPREPKKC